MHTTFTIPARWPLYSSGHPTKGIGTDGRPLEAEILRSGTPDASPPLVFLHGLVGLNDHWGDLLAKINHELNCTCVELPLLALPGEDCSIEGVTRITERFLREYFPDGAILVGNSFGGHVALRIAIQSPSMVRGLVLAGSSGLIEKSIVADIMIHPTRGWLKRKLDELYFDPSNVREQDLDRAFAALTSKHGSRAMVKLSRSARRDVLRDHVGKIQCKTLLVWGKQDVVTPPEAAQGFADLIPASRLVWIDNCGHVPMAEGTEIFAKEMLDFVRKVRQS